jgi:2'-hydroxyisoflavone reductase
VRLGRRTLLAGAAAVGAALALVGSGGARKILVLGGSRFVGLHFVAAALARGHEVTLFNRGRTAPGVFPGAEELVGDRNGDLAALHGRRWDVVVDTWGRAPGPVERSCALLADRVAQYVYISSTTVYDSRGPEAWTEETRLATVSPGGPRTYADNKRVSEQHVMQHFAGRATIVRPAVVVGPHDTHDRFVYWPLRARAGGDMLVPGRPEEPLPFVDARDLGAWLAHVAEARVVGTYNVAGALHPLGDLIDRCVARSSVPATPVWVDDGWLQAQHVAFHSMPPLHYGGYRRCSSARAIAAGLRFRGLDVTLDDTLRWWDGTGRTSASRDTLAPARERELLALWRARA